MAAITQVPQASIDIFPTTLPSLYDHEIRFATSNRCLVYGRKCLTKFTVNFVKYTKLERFCLLFSSTLHGKTLPKGTEKFQTFYHIYLRHNYTNLFLTLIPVKSFGKIVAKRAEDSDHIIFSH